MEPIKINLWLWAKMPAGHAFSVGDFVALLDRRIAYFDGVLAALAVIRSAPKGGLGEVVDALQDTAADMRNDAQIRIDRLKTEIIYL